VIPFSSDRTRIALENDLPAISGCRALIRRGSVDNIAADGVDPAVTDNGNFIIDLYFEKPIEDVDETARQLDATPGVVDHGLFISTANTVLVATDRGVLIAGDYGDVPWWGEDRPLKPPLDRLTVDNRQPVEFKSGHA
jgi:ribose 5-phosphate isomerase A